MEAAHNVVLRGGIADGRTLTWSDVGSPLEWEDVGGGATTYDATEERETIDGVDVLVYRVRAEPPVTGR